MQKKTTTSKKTFARRAASVVLLTITLSTAITSRAQTPAPSCALPDVPQAFLDLVNKPRSISVSAGEPHRPTVFNIVTKKNDLPNLFTSCRVTPVEITGEDPIKSGLRAVTIDNYARSGSDPATLRTVLLLPPTGGENPLDDAYATALCDAGFRVVLVKHWADDVLNEIDVDMHDRSAMRSTAAMEDVIEYIAPAPGQLGILGTSVGAITASLVLGVDARVSTGVLIVGGGGMPAIIASSTEAALTKLRDARLADKTLNLKDQAAYLELLKQHVKIEPLTLVNFAKQKSILFFKAMNDITVPTENQEALYQAFGSQGEVTYVADHFHTILHTALKEKKRIVDFFGQKLVAPRSAQIPPVFVGNKLCLNARASAAGEPATAAEGASVSEPTSP